MLTSLFSFFTPLVSVTGFYTDDETEIWNLVWTKPQMGQATTKGFAIYIIVPGHNKSSPVSSARVSYEILSKESFRWIYNISFHGLYIKKFTDTNSLNNAKQHNVNWICKC